MEKRYFHKDGHIVWVLLAVSLVRDEHGHPLYFVSQIQDVTERKNTEAALRASEARQRALLAALPDLVFRLDRAGTFLEVTSDRPSDLLVPAAAIVGRSVTELLPAPVAARLLAAIDRVGRAGAMEVIDYELELEGGVRGFEARLVPTGDGEIVAVVRDVSDQRAVAAALRAATEAAEEANRLKSSFLATMSHELRTPMTAILGYAELLTSGMGGELTDQQAEDIRLISQGAERLLALINDVLDLSRIEAGRIELAPEEVDLAWIVEQVRADSAPQAQAKGVDLVIALPTRLPPVVGDSERLRQIVLNLVGNAVKFTDRGQVMISAVAGDDQVRVAVADTGIGIAPEALPHVFEEFRQADGSTTRRFGGSGLGLAIAKHLAELHGGTIEVASEPSAGTTFTLCLPIAKGGGAADSASVAPE